jgi:calcineurin-like phosphoesterase family protein
MAFVFVKSAIKKNKRSMLKLKLKPGQRLYFTSDNHYNHSNLCSAVTKWRQPVVLDGGEVAEVIPDSVRNFDSLEKMNSTIVNNINAVVDQDDILISLGDWSFGGFDKIEEFRNRLVCQNIYLITGNHDHHQVNNRSEIQSIFTKVIEYYTQLEVTYNSVVKNGLEETVKFVLCHFPICSWHDMNKGVIELFGHVHLPPNKKLREGKAMDVGMDGNNFKPYSLTEILSIMKNQPVRQISIPEDHHAEDFVKKN